MSRRTDGRMDGTGRRRSKLAGKRVDDRVNGRSNERICARVARSHIVAAVAAP